MYKKAEKNHKQSIPFIFKKCKGLRWPSGWSPPISDISPPVIITNEGAFLVIWSLQMGVVPDDLIITNGCGPRWFDHYK